jgi:hypothetical protein
MSYQNDTYVPRGPYIPTAKAITVTFEPNSPRAYAILRKVWGLSQEERKLLDRNFIVKATADTLSSHLEDKDTIFFKGVEYQIEYHMIGAQSILNAPGNKLFLVYLRSIFDKGIFIALVREAYEMNELSLAALEEVLPFESKE